MTGYWICHVRKNKINTESIRLKGTDDIFDPHAKGIILSFFEGRGVVDSLMSFSSFNFIIDFEETEVVCSINSEEIL